MSKDEGTLLIRHLVKRDPNDRMRKKVFALAYEAGIIWGDTLDDKKMNAAKLNKFLKEKGAIRKELNKMNKVELIKTVNQFEQIVKHKGESNASKLTNNLLDELNIQREKKTKSKSV